MLPNISGCEPHVLHCLGPLLGNLFERPLRTPTGMRCLQGQSWQQPPPPEAPMLVGQGWPQFPAPPMPQAGFPAGVLPPYGQPPPPPFGQPFVQGQDWLPPQSHGMPPGASCMAGPSAANVLLRVTMLVPSMSGLAGDMLCDPSQPCFGHPWVSCHVLTSPDGRPLGATKDVLPDLLCPALPSSSAAACQSGALSSTHRRSQSPV